MHAPNLSENDIWDAPLRCERAFARAGIRVLARVHERPDAVDFALRTEGLMVVRCVYRATTNDCRALGEMVSVGDFHRAALVYAAEDQPHLCGEIESYPLSRIDELAASLARESAP